MALDENMVIPGHVALILDGNGRWAKKRGLPRTMGHKEGCVTVEKTVEIAARMGIRYLTVYGFSTENWKRSAEEVGALMQLFRYYMVRLLKIASANNVRVKMIGDRSRFDRDIIDGINRLESEEAGTRSAGRRPGWQETAPLERRIRTRWMRRCLHRIWIRRECRTRTF